jgi:hypothetical protein
MRRIIAEADECGDGCRVALEVASKTMIAADPGEGSLHDPLHRQGDEAV